MYRQPHVPGVVKGVVKGTLHTRKWVGRLHTVSPPSVPTQWPTQVRQQSWAYWNYKAYDDITTIGRLSYWPAATDRDLLTCLLAGYDAGWDW